MARFSKAESESRESKMFHIFEDFYTNPQNEGKKLSVGRANEMFKKETGAMMRNNRAYEIRDSVQTQLQGSKKPGPRLVALARESKEDAPQVREQKAAATPVLVTGSSDQIAWLRDTLARLSDAGLTNARVEHTGPDYAVIVKHQN